MTIVEIIATVFGLLCVWLTVRQNIWCWPTGLVQVLLYIWIFLDAKLYSDMVLHIFYVALSIYGWWYWLHGTGRRKEALVTRMRIDLLVWFVVLSCIVTTALGYSMHRYTDASLPFPDAFTTVLSLVAQYLMAKKKLESWGFWVIVDVVAIGVYFVKGLYFTTGLYCVFLGLAVLGWHQWARSMKSISVATATA